MLLKMWKRCGLLVALQFVCSAALATTAAPAHYPSPLTCFRDFYVSPLGSDTATCGAGPIGTNTNCATPWGADAATSIGGTATTLRGGDCVHVQGTPPVQTVLGSSGYTTYSANNFITFNNSGNANTPGGYINYVCTVNHGCYIPWPNCATTNGNNGARINGNFVAFDGFEFDGINQQGFTGYVETNTNIYNLSGGIFQTSGAGHHHIMLNNILHGSGGSAVSTIGTDYEYLIANEIYDTAGTNTCHTSAVSYYEPTQISGYTQSGTWDNLANHIQILGNVIHDSGEQESELHTACGALPTVHTDGNCIILNDFQHTQSAGVAYPFGALIAYNLNYQCGGRAIDVESSTNATVVNNTNWAACQDGTFAGCAAGLFENVNCNTTTSLIQNNIFVRTAGSSGDNSGTSATGGFALRVDSGSTTGTAIKNNLTFDQKFGGTSLGQFSGGTINSSLNPLFGLDPQLTSPMTDFHPILGSRVIGQGASDSTITPIVAFATPDDFVPHSPPNVGAFNTPVAGPPPPSNPFILGLSQMGVGYGVHPVPTTCPSGWATIAGGFCQLALTSGTSWLSPVNWNNLNNTVEAIGAGGGAIAAAFSGGGGEYCKITNFNVPVPGTTTINYVIGAGVTGGAGTNTSWNSTSLVAIGGGQGTTLGGGAGGTGGTGETCFNGGAASSIGGGIGIEGGGGAAGPNGVGGAGGGNTSASTGGSGGGGGGGGTAGVQATTGAGANGGGIGGGAGGASGVNGAAGTCTGSNSGGGGGGGGCGAIGGVGGPGCEWSAVSAGSGGGSGGDGNSSTATATMGGLYGGGSAPSATTSAIGAQGVIILTFHP